MAIPFLLYEMDFDAELFKQYYGSIDSPGIYAIPEDEVEPSLPENQEVPDSQVEQLPVGNPDTQTNLPPEPQQPQISPEDQQKLDNEIKELKKVHLINRLYKLHYFLKSEFSLNSDLDLLLKYSAFLSYDTLKILAYQIIAYVDQQTKQKQIEDQQREQSFQIQDLLNGEQSAQEEKV